MHINIKDIKLLPNLIRQKKAEQVPKQSDEYLRDSIKNVGMKEPITVLRLGEYFLLVDGYRRLKAIKQLHSIGELHESVDLKAIPAVIHDDGSPEVLRYMLDIRQDIPYSLQAEYIKILIENHGKTKKEIAQLYGISPASIENWMVILKCISEVQRAIDKGRLPMSAGKIFSTLKEKGQQLLCDRLKDYTKVTRDRINREARRISKTLYNIPDREERRKLASALINKKKGHVHEDRTELRVRKRIVMDDIVVAEKEHDYLERQVKFYSDAIREYVTIMEIWLRSASIKNYLETNYPKPFGDIAEIIHVELGRKI
ncbi:MAG: ParB N-terminal domain-containing protein [Candidatus Omnitrophica bacterium]|nr:ParB N-terminal domain-containing protein [Candidatus Omnitrophota bacterium]